MIRWGVGKKSCQQGEGRSCFWRAWAPTLHFFRLGSAFATHESSRILAPSQSFFDGQFGKPGPFLALKLTDECRYELGYRR